MVIRMMSDYGWQLKCLESRLQHPEWYEKEEDVQATIISLIKYLARNKEAGKAEGLYTRFLAFVGAKVVYNVLESEAEECATVKIVKRPEKKPCSRVLYIELE